jgi:hypothetical protein
MATLILVQPTLPHAGFAQAHPVRATMTTLGPSRPNHVIMDRPLQTVD